MVLHNMRSEKGQLTLNDIRYNNTVHLFTDIVNGSGVTRSELAEKNGISLMTVKNIADDLLGMGLVEERQLKSSVGRKPMALWLNSRYGNIVCVNLSTLHEIRFNIYDLAGNLLEKGRTAFRTRNYPIRDIIGEVIGEIKKKLETVSTETVGIAVFVPGVYYEDEDVIKFAMIDELNDLHIKGIFREEFGIDNIRIMHDTFASASSEYAAHSSGNDSQFYLYCGDGVGGCFTNSDGLPVLGENKLAGEVGNMIISWGKEEKPVRLEDKISITGIRAMLPDAFREEDFETILKEHGQEADVKNVLEKAAEASAQMLYNLTWLYNPTRIVVDSYCEEYADLIIRSSEAFFRKYFGEEILRNVTITRASCDEYHTMQGCMQDARSRWIERVVMPAEPGKDAASGKKEGIV